MRAALSLVALLAAAAPLSGCERPGDPPVNSTASSAVAASWPPAGAVTVENWGEPDTDPTHPVPPARRVRIGEPVTFFHDNLAITLVITSLAHATDVPPDLLASTETGTCGNYWVAHYKVTLEARNTTWGYWYGSPQFTAAFFPNRQGRDGELLAPDAARTQGAFPFGDKNTSDAFMYSIQRAGAKHEKEPTYTDSFTGREFYPVCSDYYKNKGPSDKPLGGVRWFVTPPNDVKAKSSIETHMIAEWWL